MSRRTRAWQLLFSASLLLGCNGSGCNNPNTGTTVDAVDAKCGLHTQCPFGYECNYGASDPKLPQSVGQCEYKHCGLTDPCKKPQKNCALKEETAMCDRRNNDDYCDCVRPNSQDVPNTPTTGGPSPPPTGGTPTTGDKP